MARDRANINTAIWTSDDFRDLTRPQMGLYFMLVTHPKLNYVGVTDWRVARLAAIATGDSPASVQADAEALQRARFVFIDEDTEEILVRSFMRHDGLLKQPKLSISMVNAYADVASRKIREVVTFELQRLHTEHPEWAAFRQEKVMSLVKGKGSDMDAFTPVESEVLPIADAEVCPSFTLNAGQADPLHTSTATTTSTEAKASEGPRKRATRIPADFTVTELMYEYAAKKAPDVNVDLATEKFVNYWTASGGTNATKRDWVAAWRNWMLSDQEKARPNVIHMDHSARSLAKGAALLAKFDAEQSTLAQIEG